MPVVINGDTGITQAGEFDSDSSFGYKNRLINGAMVIDQRNAGASVTQTTVNQYVTDRFLVNGSVTTKFNAQQSTVAPAGFKNSLLITSSSAYSVGAAETFTVQQRIEGFNVADLGWGTADAQTVTLSFRVRSSLTGTFGGSLRNSAADRSYPFSYTISAANTWETKTITIAGDTTGTWLSDNGIGINLIFSMGTGSTLSGTAGAWAGANYTSATGATSVVGTNGATFYITGVQLEKGSTATSFDYRPYGTELNLCYRYYYKVFPNEANNQISVAYAFSTTGASGMITFPVTMRIAPAALEQSGTATDYRVYRCGSATNVICSSVPTFSDSQIGKATVNFTVASGLTNGSAGSIAVATTSGYLAWSAEL